MILHWNFNHFVVLEGFGKGVAHINDPAAGPVTITETELDEAFTGVVLTLKPTPEFKKQGEFPSILKSLRPRLRGARWRWRSWCWRGWRWWGPGLVAPTFNKIFIDDILIRGLGDWMRPLIARHGGRRR